MADFNSAIDYTLQFEGSTYTDDPNDAGGATKYGITLATLQTVNNEATKETVKDLTQDEAKEIYKELYWKSEDIQSQAIGTKLFDMGVNIGVTNSIKILQKAVNAIGTYFLTVDGKLGPKSLDFINSSDESDLMTSFCNLHEEYYWTIVKNNIDKKAVSFGWPEELIQTASFAVQNRDLSMCKNIVTQLKAAHLKQGNISFINGWVRRARERFGI